MADAYLAILRTHGGVPELLLAQKNIYLPPFGRYQYAAIGRNAVQYVIPGGRIQPGEQPADAAVREFLEDTGVKLAPGAVQPLLDKAGHYTFFKTTLEHGHPNVESVNAAIAAGKTGSQKFNHFAWVPLQDAGCRLGNKKEYHGLPWVAAQVHRAVQAGFTGELINLRANEPSGHFACAIAKLILDTLGGETGAETGSALLAPAGAP